MFRDIRELNLEYTEGCGPNDIPQDAVIYFRQCVHHLKDKDGNIIKIYVNDGSLKAPLEEIVRSCQTSYLENPDLFPKTELLARGHIVADQKPFSLALIKQEYLNEAESGTLKDYLKGEWNEVPVQRVLDKLDILRKRFSESVQIPRVESLEEFLMHEKKYQKRWNLPITSFCLYRLKKIGEHFLEGVDIEEKDKAPLSRVTRELAPRNVLVDGEKLTFDTELYGEGVAEMDLAVMFSQILNIQEDFANKFTHYVQDRYGHETYVSMLIELMGYRASELLKNKLGVGDKREDYHRIQLREATKLWKRTI